MESIQIKEASLRTSESENKRPVANGIRRVVYVPKKIDLEIEQVRKRMGYTRSRFYVYSATKMIEQKLLSTKREVKLQPWEEVIGTLRALETDEDSSSAIIECYQNLEITLQFAKGTPEAFAIQNSDNLLGQKISILKTDNAEKPIVITEAKPRLRTKIFVRICRFAKCAIPFNVVFVSLKTRCF